MKDFPLPIQHTPIAVTGVKIGDVIALDPTQEEEDVAGARLTVTTNEDGDICAMQKGNIGRLTEADVDHIVEMSIVKGAEIRKILMREGKVPAPVERAPEGRPRF
jgi:exosome complex component RRP42